MLPKKTCLQALFALSSNFMDALKRSVRIRCIVDEQIASDSMPGAITKIVDNSRFKLKVVLTPCAESLGIYDKKTVIFGCKPRQDYARTQALWTTNAPLVRIIQHYFDEVWNEAVYAHPFASRKIISLEGWKAERNTTLRNLCSAQLFVLIVLSKLCRKDAQKKAEVICALSRLSTP